MNPEAGSHPRAEGVPYPGFAHAAAAGDPGAVAAAWQSQLATYVNDAPTNDHVFEQFTRATDAFAFLKEHRDWVEAHDYGFGYRALHAMWLGMIAEVGARRRTVRALEIGVHKGQSISAWSLIGRELDLPVAVTAISPFTGNQRPTPRWLHRTRRLLDPWYRRRAAVGNLHPLDDYLAHVRRIYARFALDFEQVRVVQGLSTDEAVRAAVAGDAFDVLYIDGDHSYEVACADVDTYAPLVAPGGYLVVDDAGCDLPGTAFWKGFESVTAAAARIPGHGFTNVLNVAHNRIFRR